MRFEDNPYVTNTLDKIRSEARKDKQEYGMNQLRLIVGFLNWYNFKENSKEKIASPLLLLPVEISKKKGLKDQYLMETVSSEAEVNPVLSFYLKELYGIELPHYVDLSEVTLEEFHKSIEEQFIRSGSGIQLKHIEKPRLRLIHSQAKQKLNKYHLNQRKRQSYEAEYYDYSYASGEFAPLGLVRAILKNDSGLSIGIVAFSMAQQDHIDEALGQLAIKDSEFELALEQEYVRTEDEQFVGLFVKNLENVQGDERDIMIISVCYAPNSEGRMLMNFGPINRKGGEKRLNVIFSRAKTHMAIVSSIEYHQIKNEYNEGARYFRDFLRYAKLNSDGNHKIADELLASLCYKEEINQAQRIDIVAAQ